MGRVPRIWSMDANAHFITPPQILSCFKISSTRLLALWDRALSLKVCRFLIHFRAHQCGILTPTH